MIKITSSESFVVKPAEKSPKGKSIPLSLLDRLFGFPRYNSTVHIYNAAESDGFFDPEALRESLSKVLVHFYPVAGRYTMLDEEQGIVAINCNDEGVSFVVAESDSRIEELGDLAPSSDMKSLNPIIDYSEKDVSSYPIMSVKATYFRCGGVSLGIAIEHATVDGSSAFNLINSWAEICRGHDISSPPFLDRAIISPRDPPQPKFDHEEYTKYFSSGELSSHPTAETKVSVFKVTKETLNKMKAEANQNQETANTYTTFEALAGHIWKCACIARNVGDEQDSRLFMPVNGRSNNRMKPQLPPGFFGNAIFRALATSRVGDLKSKPLSHAASKVHEALARVDHEYTKSVLDFLAIQPNLSDALEGPHVCENPNFQVTSWGGLGLNDADFGWGPPVYSGPSVIKYEKTYVFPCVNGGFTLAIALKPRPMEIFEKVFYEFA